MGTVNLYDVAQDVKKLLCKSTSSQKDVEDVVVSSTSEDASNCPLLPRKSFQNVDFREFSRITFRILEDLSLNVVDEAEKKMDGDGVVDDNSNGIEDVSAKEISSEILEGCIDEALNSRRASAEAASREIVHACVEEALNEESEESSDDNDQSEHV